MAKEGTRSVVRTLRLDEDLNNYLIEEAKKSNISVSAISSQILTAYRDKYNFAEKLNPVAITPGNLTMFLHCISDEDLVRIAPKLASKLNLFLNHVFDDVKEVSNLEWCLTNLLPASHWFECNRSNEGYMITHQMGHKWTVFLTSFLTTMIHSETGIAPDVQVGNDILVIKNWN